MEIKYKEKEAKKILWTMMKYYFIVENLMEPDLKTRSFQKKFKNVRVGFGQIAKTMRSYTPEEFYIFVDMPSENGKSYYVYHGLQAEIQSKYTPEEARLTLSTDDYLKFDDVWKITEYHRGEWSDFILNNEDVILKTAEKMVKDYKKHLGDVEKAELEGKFKDDYRLKIVESRTFGF